MKTKKNEKGGGGGPTSQEEAQWVFDVIEKKIIEVIFKKYTEGHIKLSIKINLAINIYCIKKMVHE